VPLLLVLTEGGLPVVGVDWGMDDVVLADAGPAELDARLRLAIDRGHVSPVENEVDEIEAGELRIDAGGYTARLRGRALDLTYKEFELLKYLSQHPGRVFTRAQLLQEVWGYDYFGGTRTVDVHVRRLRAKLGPEHDSMIGTVRNVGYRFESPRDRRDRDAAGSVGSNATATGVARSATGAGAGAAGRATGAGGAGARGAGRAARRAGARERRAARQARERQRARARERRAAARERARERRAARQARARRPRRATPPAPVRGNRHPSRGAAVPPPTQRP